VDTSQPVTEIAYQWMNNTGKDFGEFLLDMTFRGDINAVMFKIAGFTKRQTNRLITALLWLEGKLWIGWVATKHGVLHMAHGLKALFKDGKWVVKQNIN